MSRDGQFVYNQTYIRGWKGYVDGLRCRIHAAERARIGINVGAGEHAVALTYDPLSPKVGLLLSAIALSGAISWLLSVPVSRSTEIGEGGDG